MFSCVLISLLEIKCCASFKNEFLMGRVGGGGGEGGVKFSKILMGFGHKRGAGSDRFRIFWGT